MCAKPEILPVVFLCTDAEDPAHCTINGNDSHLKNYAKNRRKLYKNVMCTYVYNKKHRQNVQGRHLIVPTVYNIESN